MSSHYGIVIPSGFHVAVYQRGKAAKEVGKVGKAAKDQGPDHFIGKWSGLGSLANHRPDQISCYNGR